MQVIEHLVNFPKRGLDTAAQVCMLTAAIKVYVSSPEDEATKLYEVCVGIN